MDGAVACLDVMAKQASELDARQDRHVPLDYSLKYIPGTAAYSCRLQEMPVGVVAAITPWNYPLQMAIWKIAPLLAAGCTCVLKPSEVTPLSALALALLTNEAGLPPGVFNVITGLGGEVGQPLAEHVDVAKVAFTGSTTVGAHLMNVAAKQVKNITLELGGKSALIVFEDAVETLERTVDLVIAGVVKSREELHLLPSLAFAHSRHLLVFK